MDKVFINQLQVDTVIGIYDWEKEIQQSLFLDLEMDWDISRAAKSDDYQYALCYETVSNRLIELVSEKPIELIETVAELVACCLLDEFHVSKVMVTVNKPGAVKQAANVGVKIIRTKNL
ncbi:dihydroneopterin aldolase [Shewanella sp. 202IG2-18]|uniref:dihydroneopterin aldolase n=1 Tax=Parashewanella hymeniacidonis TaxID=2807618 RepID=UPI00195FB64F|nr:dihydroneopterin aldolase [Parashewanella hymeniacidonis]MBM7073359.1 dihydroneopterin aldolase [Parashewanella hymeniacidonis]